MNNKVAYIVVGWNNRDLLAECIDSIEQQSYKSGTIIYVDNGSKDNSVAFMRSTYPKVRIVEPGFNTGFAKGNNIGISLALKEKSIKYVVLLNTDARLDKHWTSKVINLAEHKPKGALYQGTTFDYYNHQVIDSTHTYLSQNGQGTQGNWRYYYKTDLGPKKVFGVNAAACLITRAFLEAQPFKEEYLDEMMFMYLEDVDIVARAIVMGWDNYLVRGAKAYHMGSASSGKNPGYSLYMTFRNNSAVLFKNLPLSMLIRMLPKIIRGDIETIKTLRRTNRDYAVKKVAWGRIAGLIRLPIFIRKRYIMRRTSNISTQELWQLMIRGY